MYSYLFSRVVHFIFETITNNISAFSMPEQNHTHFWYSVLTIFQVSKNVNMTLLISTNCNVAVG